jgi:hypothetical protein
MKYNFKRWRGPADVAKNEPGTWRAERAAGLMGTERRAY